MDILSQGQWALWFGDLLFYCFGFLSHQWNVFGYHISILNCWIMVESFYILMDFVGEVFGHTEVQNGE